MGKYESPATRAVRAQLTIQKNRNRQGAFRRSKIIARYGLPPDSKLLFFKKHSHFNSPPTALSYGTVVCFDQDTSKLLLVAKFHEKSNENQELFDEFNNCISALYKHGQARYEVKNNGAANAAKAGKSGGGKMHAIGFRPGYDPEVKLGVYALNPKTCKSSSTMEEDRERQIGLPKIERFLDSRFSHLSLHTYKSNLQVASETGAPSWASNDAHVPEGAHVFASNLVITFDGFFNDPHEDDDSTDYAIGLFAQVHRENGTLYSPGPDAPKGKVVGSKFIFKDYNFFIDYDACPGVVEQVWNTKVDHYTPPSKTLDCEGKEIPIKDSFVTRFGDMRKNIQEKLASSLPHREIPRILSRQVITRL